MSNKLANIDDVAGKIFDFVVIGGGTAGCVVASRLSENPDVSVLLLEAGAPHLEDELVDESLGWLRILFNPEYDWQFGTTPQSRVVDAPFFWPRGKGLGGSSQVNWLIWQMPQKHEIDALEAVGNKGWNWDTFHQYAKKVERFIAPEENPDEKFKNLYDANAFGHNGPIPITFLPHGSTVEHVWQKTLRQHGVPTIDTAHNGEIRGTWKGVNNVDPVTGKRVSAAKGYIVPVLDRPNLKVLPNAYVQRVLNAKGGGDVVATGVEFEHGGQTYRVDVAKDVILSAGAVKSPQILELSGIGDRNIIEKHGLKCVLDLPAVGTNILEHIVCGTPRWRMKPETGVISAGMLNNPTFLEELRKKRPDIKDAYQMGVNTFTYVSLQDASSRAKEVVQMQRDKFAHEAKTMSPGLRVQYEEQLKLLANPEIPDFEVMFFPFPFPAPTPEPDKPYISILPILGRPFSRGTIHIDSADPKAHPEIDPHYLEEGVDLEIVLEAFKFIRKITQTAPFSDYIMEEELPGKEVATDEQLRDWVRKNLFSSFHTAGGCPMLPRELDGVLDTKLKVYGTKNVRVVDLSILPQHVSVHPQATVYAIAEQASDIIKGDHHI